MQTMEVEVFSTVVNAAVIRLPGRKFPGIVIQGDSMKVMLGWIQEIADLSRGSMIPDLNDSAEELLSIISGYIKAYETAMDEHNHPLPYSKPNAG